MGAAVVKHHVPIRRKRLLASGVDAWNPNSSRPLLAATGVLLATILQMNVEELLGGEGCNAEWAGKCNSLMVLGPGIGVVGAWIDAQLGSVLWTIVDEHLLELQNVLNGPVVDVALVLATNEALLPLL